MFVLRFCKRTFNWKLSHQLKVSFQLDWKPNIFKGNGQMYAHCTRKYHLCIKRIRMCWLICNNSTKCYCWENTFATAKIGSNVTVYQIQNVDGRAKWSSLRKSRKMLEKSANIFNFTLNFILLTTHFLPPENLFAAISWTFKLSIEC